MKQINRKLFFFFILLLGFSLAAAQEVQTMKKVFAAKKTVKIKSISGDCIVEKGSAGEIVVEVEYNVQPKSAFTPEMKESGNSIKIKEEWRGSGNGHVTWKLKVPAGTEIDFSSASGDISILDVLAAVEASTASGDINVEYSEGGIEASTASGDVNLKNVSGEISISTASGDIKGSNLKGDIELSAASGDLRIKNSEGAFELSCASGDIEAKNIKLSEEATFSVASGDVEVSLAETPKFGIEISSASGDATLDYNGNALKGYFELTARKDRGKIDAPQSFDNEEEFERNGQSYERKSFSVGGKTPQIIIETASGKAQLKK